MIKELRAILNDLKPRVLEELGLETAINKLSEKIARENKIKRQVNIIGLDDRIDDKLEVTIFRIIQESLSNIVKHSGAKEFDISLISENGNIRLLISDDGTGFDEQSNNINNFQEGFGLKNIKERVENLGGSFKIETAQNEGTLLLIELPIKEKVYVP
jgi:signal transduction histidine kinase